MPSSTSPIHGVRGATAYVWRNVGLIVKRGAYVLDRNDRSVSAYENGYSIPFEQIARFVKGLMRGLLGYAQDHRGLTNAHGHDARVIEQLDGGSFRFCGS